MESWANWINLAATTWGQRRAEVGSTPATPTARTNPRIGANEPEESGGEWRNEPEDRRGRTREACLGVPLRGGTGVPPVDRASHRRDAGATCGSAANEPEKSAYCLLLTARRTNPSIGGVKSWANRIDLAAAIWGPRRVAVSTGHPRLGAVTGGGGSGASCAAAQPTCARTRSPLPSVSPLSPRRWPVVDGPRGSGPLLDRPGPPTSSRNGTIPRRVAWDGAEG